MAVRKKTADPLSALLQERQRLLADIAEKQKSVAESHKRVSQIESKLTSAYRQIAKTMSGFFRPGVLSEAAQAAPLWDGQSAVPPDADRVANVKRKGSALSEPIRTVLRETGRAMTTRELFEELERREVKIGGQRPMANLSAHMTNVEGVERQGNGWALKSPTVQ